MLSQIDGYRLNQNHGVESRIRSNRSNRSQDLTRPDLMQLAISFPACGLLLCRKKRCIERTLSAVIFLKLRTTCPRSQMISQAVPNQQVSLHGSLLLGVTVAPQHQRGQVIAFALKQCIWFALSNDNLLLSSTPFPSFFHDSRFPLVSLCIRSYT